MPFPYFLRPRMKVSKEALSTASSPVATEYLHYSSFISKNAKLAPLKQSHFLHEKKEPPFCSVEVSTGI